MRLSGIARTLLVAGLSGALLLLPLTSALANPGAVPGKASPKRPASSADTRKKAAAKTEVKQAKGTATRKTAKRSQPARTAKSLHPVSATLAEIGSQPMRAADRAEARLIEVYGLWGRGQGAQALTRARELVRDHPNFQAAQLMYADLLSLRLAPPDRHLAQNQLQNSEAQAQVRDLRAEQSKRLQALQHRPPAGSVPSQLLAVPRGSRYALAVDVSRSRLYVLRNTANGLVLEKDFYVSIGKSGAGKTLEGDARTPLGVYHITSHLSPKGLRDFYGAGALPINYPNPYDQRIGRTGSGIWLHGVPPDQYARAPLATDGCVVLADNDLRQLVRMTDIGATAVVIAQQLDWIPVARAAAQVEPLRRQVLAWRDARAQGDLARWQTFYMPDAVRNGRLARQYPSMASEMSHVRAQPSIEIKDLSALRWRDRHELAVVSFGEVAEGARTGAMRRQYWLQSAQGWKIFHEERL